MKVMRYDTYLEKIRNAHGINNIFIKFTSSKIKLKIKTTCKVEKLDKKK